jgi:NitT/TauT family transport system substrate-binding protein
MRAVKGLSCGVAALLLLLAAPCARAEVGEVRIVRQGDFGDLPLLVAEHEKLIEKHADMMGLGEVTVRWLGPGKNGTVEAIGSGQSDLAALDVAAFVAAWDEKTGTEQEIRALAALEQLPYVLVSRNPNIQTIRDFKDKDRIAVPALRASGPALLLQMAAAQEWGDARFNKFDLLVTARPDAEVAAALLSGKGDADSHFSRMPYADNELASPKVHRVMDSFDVAGPHSSAALIASARFHDANPMLCSAILAAIEEAMDLIKDNPGDAAEIYTSMVKDQAITVEDLADMIGDPDLGYTTVPAGVLRIAEFLHRTGQIKHRPASWQELFFSEAHNLPGS